MVPLTLQCRLLTPPGIFTITPRLPRLHQTKTDSPSSCPSVVRHLEGIQKYLDAGFERIAILQAGRDQDGFFGFWNEELKPRLEKVGVAARHEAAARVAPRN